MEKGWEEIGGDERVVTEMALPFVWGGRGRQKSDVASLKKQVACGRNLLLCRADMLLHERLSMPTKVLGESIFRRLGGGIIGRTIRLSPKAFGRAKGRRKEVGVKGDIDNSAQALETYQGPGLGRVEIEIGSGVEAAPVGQGVFQAMETFSEDSNGIGQALNTSIRGAVRGNTVGGDERGMKEGCRQALARPVAKGLGQMGGQVRER